ncbi:hypothetical protein HDV64DRAFT_291416 [Trichoderma sp. TUCIM 5745]
MQRHTAFLNFHSGVSLAVGKPRNCQSIVCKSTFRVHGERCALRTAIRRNGRISICEGSVDGQWMVDEDAGKLPRQLQPKSHVRASSQLSSRPLVWPSIVGSQQGRILQRHGTLGFGPWPTPSCSPPMRNAAAAAAWSFRAFTFASTPQKDDNRRPPNLCHPSSCFDLQVQAAKYG